MGFACSMGETARSLHGQGCRGKSASWRRLFFLRCERKRVMRSTVEFARVLLIVGLLLLFVALALSSHPMKGGLILTIMGYLLFGCGWCAVNQARPPEPPTNLMQWCFWKVETLPPLSRAIIGNSLWTLGLVLVALSLVWMAVSMVAGPILWVAQLSKPIFYVSVVLIAILAALA